MTDNSVRISTLDETVTVYDLEGNIIRRIPEPPETPPEVTYFNILEYEDRLMGIDPDARPDFFMDFENDERFPDIDRDPRFSEPVKLFDWVSVTICSYAFVIFSMIFALGYVITDI